MRQCVKVEQLRKKYGKDADLSKWLSDPTNVYVGRRGRIFINKVIYHYEGSRWQNDFTLKEYSLDDSLELYKQSITSKIDKDPITYDLCSLKGKTLGCWCNPGDRCHVDVLINLVHSAP